jgi:enoyl-CoA hydratase
MPETLSLSYDGKVAHVELCRPDELNTMTFGFWQEMVDVFNEIDAAPEVRCVVLSAQGKHFTAGLDLIGFAGFMAEIGQGEPARAREQLRRTVLEMQESFNVVERCRVPVIAVTHGACIGGGVDLITACDMRVCSADTFFRVQEVNVAITADVGTLQRLPRLIPDGLARELCYTGRKLHAEEALAAGLVNTVREDREAALAWAFESARDIASKSPVAIAGIKEVMNHARDHSVADGLRYVAAWQSGMLFSADLMEQMAARQQRRDAEFADLLPPRGIVSRP